MPKYNSKTLEYLCDRKSIEKIVSRPIEIMATSTRAKIPIPRSKAEIQYKYFDFKCFDTTKHHRKETYGAAKAILLS
jgi:hypothetical protein